jgi:hypothetical protein
MRERNNRILGLCIVFLTLGIPAFATPIPPKDLGNGWSVTYEDSSAANHVIRITKFSNGSFEIDKVFSGSFTPITITFTRNTPGSSANTLVIRDEYIQNKMGVTWTDYHISLESVGNLVAFDTNQGNPNALKYNKSIAAFNPGIFSGPLAIDFYGGSLNSGSGFQISPGGIGPKMTIKIDPSCNTFTLSQVPTPEPATLIFLAVGLVGMNKLRSRVNPSSIKAMLVVMALGFILFLSGSSAQAAFIGWSAPDLPDNATITKWDVSSDGRILTLDIEKTFTGDPIDNMWGPILITLQNDSSSSIKTIVINETVKNQTTSPWDFYGMAIATDDESVKITALPTTDPLSVRTMSPDQLEIGFSNFTVPMSTILKVYNMNIDVSSVEIGESFLLKEWATTPEPVSLVLLATGGLVLIRRKK